MPDPGDPLDPSTTIFFLCDIQTRFRNAIHAYDQVIITANKLVKLAKLVGCEVVATTQNARALGPIDPQIDTSILGPLFIGSYDKTRFSMITHDIQAVLEARPHIKSVVLFGIESHVCVLQTTLSLLALSRVRSQPITPYLPLDGISSCNSFEIGVAIARMREAGATITTSESLAFELMRDAGLPNFKEFSKFIKEEKERTKTAGERLILGQGTPEVLDQSEIAGGGILLDDTKPSL
ncbi:Isochorismatase hydrolase [Macrolepiota fuliginosa MF-IS2]|uniref:Isochorismatase hydrolase n=1 Tax=Macrolepiota fuliginosa MF-IS2 TaxID=1400762 RepID=A0A9P5XKD7_9AGAR|nr:Isochorismatase hydrolase [Macrolepiota fuliginosa MF-IS2]